MSISGKLLSALIGATPINGAHGWEAEEAADDLDRTTGADLGYTNTDAGCLSLTVRLKLYFDDTTGAVEVVNPGTIIANLKLFKKATDVTPAYAMASAIVIGRVFTVEVRGKMEVNCTVKNRGAYVYEDTTV